MKIVKELSVEPEAQASGGVAFAAGLAIAFVDNHQGRSIQIGATKPGTRVVFAPVVVARDKGQLDALVRVLRSFRDDLPDAPPTVDDELRTASRGEDVR